MAASPLLPDLTDALARGRLAIAELAGMTSAELDAVHGMALARLEVGQDAQAAELLGGLVALFPFGPRYWRAYGLALHRLRSLSGARRAYDAALALEPGHETTLGLRGEVLALLGDHAAARRDLEAAARSTERDVSRRAAELLRRLAAGGRTTTPVATPSPEPAAAGPAAAFVLHDERPLPLAAGRIATAMSYAAGARVEVTAVTQPLARLPRAVDAAPPGRLPAPVTHAGEGAPVVAGASAGDTITALVGRDRRAAAAGTAERAEVTHTAIVRRGAGLELDPEESP